MHAPPVPTTQRRWVAVATSLALAITAVSIAGPAQATPGSQLQADANAINAIGTTGVLAEVDDNGTLTRARAGSMAAGSNTPVDWNSHFRIGSNTKTFTAVVVLQLAAEGRLSLDDTLDRWLPVTQVTGHGNHGDHITIRQVLQHTSGIPDYLDNPTMLNTILTAEQFQANWNLNHTLDELLGYAMQLPPTFGPGARWSYSNTNYIVAGLVIQAVTGHSWSQEVRDRIIVPLQLTETSEPGSNPYLPSPHPQGYQYYNATDYTLTNTTNHNMTWGASAGSLISTPHDINRFFRALIGGQLLPPAMLAQMLTTVNLPSEYQEIWPGAVYGLGIFGFDLPCGGRYWSHGGDVIGYSISNGVTTDGTRAVAVSSSSNTFTNPQFAADAIRTNDDLVQNALCGAATTTAAVVRSTGPTKPTLPHRSVTP